MSQQPEPPACIAEAIRSAYQWQATGRIGGPDPKPEDFKAHVCAEDAARAVWAALLAEGQLRVENWSDGEPEWQRVLVIPLPVVEPRDTEQA